MCSRMGEGIRGYKEFDGRPIGARDFPMGGSEREAVDWMREHTNAEALIAEAATDRAARESFDDWTTGHFMHGQQYKGWDNMTTRDQLMTQTYDDYLDRATVSAPVTIMRLATPELLGLGRDLPTAEQLAALKGATVTSRGHMSCAAAKEGLTISFSTRPYTVGKFIEYKFNIPGGTKGAGMWIGDSRINPTWGARQREFMMNRDTEWRVGDAKYDSHRGCYVVEMEWVGRHEHDYGTTGRRPRYDRD